MSCINEFALDCHIDTDDGAAFEVSTNDMSDLMLKNIKL